MRAARQLAFSLRSRPRWGGPRPGSGRKRGMNPGLPHRSRSRFPGRYPAHVTLKMRPDVPSLRSVRLVREIERSFAAGCERGQFRVVHYSLQSDHAHLLVEAANRHALGRGMKAIGARLARAVNRVCQRRGPVLADRFHLRVLRTPREVRAALAYVLLNARRHARRVLGAVSPDPASSARWFDGWRRERQMPAEVRGGAPVLRAEVSGGHPALRPVARARTWLLGRGWRRHGLLDPSAVPGPRR